MCAPTKLPKKKYHLSQIYEEHIGNYLRSKERKLVIKDKHLEAVNKAIACQTDKLGIAVFACKSCGDTVNIPRSCKHRFCSRCGNAETMRWADNVLSSLLDMKHHHIVATLPQPFRFLSKMNGNLFYDLLFQASAEVIKSWFTSRHKLRPGIVSTLHTAGSDLKHHPHVHMIVSGGGQDIETKAYRELEGDYLCPQKFFGEQLRIKFQVRLIKLFDEGKIKTPDRISAHKSFVSWLYDIKQKHWVVSIQKPLADLGQIVGYVGRYTKRACLSEYKIIEIGKTVKFKYNDYKNTPRGEKPREGIRELSPYEFLDELLQHVPDKRYRMVRYFGIYNSLHLKKIPEELRGQQKIEEIEIDENFEWGEFEEFRKSMIRSGKSDPLFCSTCKESMVLVLIQLKGKTITVTADDTS